MKGLVVWVILWFHALSVSAGELSVCDDALIAKRPQTGDKPWTNIPFDCEHPELARLNDNRAQLYELMSDFNNLNRAVSADKSAQAYYEAYRILIGLAESFVMQAMARGDLDALTRLNDTYRQYIEITELRLKGYDLLANRLERELR